VQDDIGLRAKARTQKSSKSLQNVSKTTDEFGSRPTDLGRESAERRVLEQWAKSRTLAARIVLRSRLVLMLADGQPVRDVASMLNVSPTTVRLWRTRFALGGPEGLSNDAPGRGRKPALDAAARDGLRRGFLNGDAMSVRQRARELGVSPSTVSRWRRRDS